MHTILQSPPGQQVGKFLHDGRIPFINGSGCGVDRRLRPPCCIAVELTVGVEILVPMLRFVPHPEPHLLCIVAWPKDVWVQPLIFICCSKRRRHESRVPGDGVLARGLGPLGIEDRDQVCVGLGFGQKSSFRIGGNTRASPHIAQQIGPPWPPIDPEGIGEWIRRQVVDVDVGLRGRTVPELRPKPIIGTRLEERR